MLTVLSTPDLVFFLYFLSFFLINIYCINGIVVLVELVINILWEKNLIQK